DWAEAHGRPDWLDPPPLPRSGVRSLDALLDRCDRLLTDYVEACRRLAPNRPSFRDVGAEASSILAKGDKADPEGIAKAQHAYGIYQPDTDFWAQKFARAA